MFFIFFLHGLLKIKDNKIKLVRPRLFYIINFKHWKESHTFGNKSGAIWKNFFLIIDYIVIDTIKI